MMFVIQSYARSGTHMVKTALNGHPKIRCFGEVFNPDCPDGVNSTNEILNRMRSAKIQTGFVEHALRGSSYDRNGRGNTLWTDIKKAKRTEKIIVINLFRENLFERFISRKVAIKTGQWGTKDPNYILKTDPWRVNPKEAMKDFKKTLSIREEARLRFPQAPWFSYEDLIVQWNQTLRKIQKKLGVNPKNLMPKTIKQGRSMRETITNYDEVKAYFANTKFSKFFTE